MTKETSIELHLDLDGTGFRSTLNRRRIPGDHLLEASEQDIEFKHGKFTVAGTDRSKTFGEIALTAYVPHNYPQGVEPGFEESAFFDPPNFTYPSGTYVCELEVDPDAVVGDLSVGLQQRVEILKVLHRGATVVLLDDFSGDGKPDPRLRGLGRCNNCLGVTVPAAS